MSLPDRATYLQEITDVLRTHWPENRAIHIVCHGHSVPSGYFATPMVDTFNAYPHLLHRQMKNRFPFAVINVIVTAIGGENSESGSKRFTDEVLCHRPDVLTIDYGLNDRNIGPAVARGCWEEMIEGALEAGAKVILLTPTADTGQLAAIEKNEITPLSEHAEQIRELADRYEVGLVDSLALFEDYARRQDLHDLMSWSNHPSNRAGHDLVTRELLRWFPAR